MQIAQAESLADTVNFVRIDIIPQKRYNFIQHSRCSLFCLRRVLQLHERRERPFFGFVYPFVAKILEDAVVHAVVARRILENTHDTGRGSVPSLKNLADGAFIAEEQFGKGLVYDRSACSREFPGRTFHPLERKD